MSDFKTSVTLFSLPLLVLFSVLFPLASFASDLCVGFYSGEQKIMVPQVSPLWGNRLHLHRRPWTPKIPKFWTVITEGPQNTSPQTDFWKIIYPYIPNRGNLTLANRETRNIDQASSKECFLFSFLSSLESSYANRTSESRTVQFRPEYLLAKKFEHAISDLLEQVKDPIQFNIEGGEYFHALELVKKYGLVPADIWRPLVPAEYWNYDRIYKTIKDETDIVRTNLYRNPNYYGSKTRAQLVKEILDKALQDDLNGPYIGAEPKPFVYDGIEHTTETFGKMYGHNFKGPLDLHYVYGKYPYQDPDMIFPLANWTKKTFPQYLRPYFRPQPLHDLLNDIKNGLVNGKSVTVDINGNGAGGFGHTLSITDIEITPSGEVVALKLKNTYRWSWGYNGYIWLSPKELDKIVRRVWIVDVN